MPPGREARRRGGLARVAWLMGLLLLAGGAADPGEVPFRPDQVALLQATLEEAVARCRVPGAVAAVRSPQGALWTGAGGLAELAAGEAMTTAHHFHVGSVTKTLTATAILQLVDRGALALDDTVAGRLPGLLRDGQEITLRDLLRMRSGLAHYDQCAVFGEAFANDPRRVWTAGELVALSDQRRAAPGETCDYNNVNYLILGLVIEKVTGMSYARAVQTMILAPLGMTHSLVPATAEMPVPYAHGYLWADGQVVDVSTVWDPSAFGSAGSLISTLGDMLVWSRALMTGSLLTPASHRAQFELVPAESRPGSAYGLGVADLEGKVGHNGNYNGLYTAEVFAVEGHQFVVLGTGQAAGVGEGSGTAAILAALVELLPRLRP